MRKILKTVLRVLNITLTVIMIIFILANLYTLAARRITGRQNVTVFGFSAAVVLSGSMSGAIEINDIIITRSQTDYRIDDIIMFESGSATVTHRIIAINDEGYLTRGDANNTDDKDPIAQEKVIGKVIAVIPKVGVLIAFFQTPFGMLLLVLLLLTFVGLSSLTGRKNTIADQEEEPDDKEEISSK